MKKTLTTAEVADILCNDNNANWSRSGACALAEYLEDMEAELGIEVELDVIAIRCEYSEYECFADIAEAYAINIDVNGDNNEIRAYLNDKTTVIEFDGGIIIAEY